MTKSMIQLLLNELSRVAKEEITLQRVMREEIKKVKNELESMKAFLRYVDANKEEQNPRFKSWMKQVRDVSFEIDDVVDEYLYRLADAKLRRNTIYLGKLYSTFTKLKAKLQIGSQLQSIKGKVAEIENMSKKYGLVPSSFNTFDKKSSSSSISRATQEINEFQRSTVRESQLVGIESTKRELEAWLKDGDLNFKVLAIVGMEGLGKTAMAKKILGDASHFKRRALVTISQTLKEDVFFMDLIQQLFPGEAWEMKQLPVHHRMERLRERLEDDSYLIVVDDVWKTKHWDQIKVTFPINNHGSRVVVTTRKELVARHSTKEYNGHVHKLQPLSRDDSWDLFCKKTFPSRRCPSNLELICQDIIHRKCRGVPVAILAISDLLTTLDEHNVKAWERVQHSLDLELEENLEMTKKILFLSFDNLPDHLKPCYMYLSVFPKDYPMEWGKVIRLWISEGFVEKRLGSTLEEDAESYLHDLLNRNLIQISVERRDGTERVKCFRIHDFLREFILSKSKEERFVDVISKADQEIRTRARRLSIHHCDKISSNVLPQLHSLLFFEGMESGGFKISKLLGDGFKMLGVLDLTFAPLDTFPEEISTLYLLRHLRLRHTNISVVPKFIRNLQRLETLDLKYTFVTELPDEISMLQKLRHLLISNFNTSEEASVARKYYFHEGAWQNDIYKAWGVKLTSNIRCLVSLQHLCLIEVPEDKDWLEGLGRLTQLKKLGLLNLKEQHWEQVCGSISMMTNLQSLRLQTYGSFKLDYMENPPRFLQRLHLEGQMDELPSWLYCSSLPHLQLLKLVDTKLSKDPGACLGSFPKLAGLILIEAFSEDVEMRVVLPDCFPSLRRLSIDRYGHYCKAGEYDWLAMSFYLPIWVDKVVSLT